MGNFLARKAALAAASVRPAGLQSNIVKLASHLLTGAFLIGTLAYGLLPGIMAACVGFLLVNALAGEHTSGSARIPRMARMWPGIKPGIAATLVIVLPLVGICFLSLNAKGVVFGALAQYQALLHQLAGTVLDIRQKLPADLATHLPDQIGDAQLWLADYLKSKAHALSGLGTAGLHGALLVYVGLMVGALARLARPVKDILELPGQAPLRLEIRTRASHFVGTFSQVITAQFWIAVINAAATALFLLVVLPLFDVSMPYVSQLIALTFFCGLLPIVGNLVCNSVITIAGVSISPEVGLACLVFLIIVHKVEYLVNAKCLGRQTNTAAWELLSVMFIGEAVFGLSGLVAAPLFYAYVKKELALAGLI